jgi:hypothetical protein
MLHSCSVEAVGGLESPAAATMEGAAAAAVVGGKGGGEGGKGGGKPKQDYHAYVKSVVVPDLPAGCV